MAYNFNPNRVKFMHYTMLNHFDFNRAVSKDHSNKIMKSIQKNDMCGVVRVTSVEESLIENNGCSDLFILDGQHTALALHKLGMAIPVYEVPNDGTRNGLIKIIAQFNTSSKAWKLNNYVEAWAKMSSMYSWLVYYNTKYRIPYDSMAAFLYKDVSRTSLANKLKSGVVDSMPSNEFELLGEHCKELCMLMQTLPEMPSSNKQRLCMYLLAKRIPISINRDLLRRRITECNYAAAGKDKEMKNKILFDIIVQGQ